MIEDFEALWFDCENFAEGSTVEEQCSCEKECANFLVPFETYSKDLLTKFRAGQLINEENQIKLLRAKHSIYLTGGLGELPSGFVTLDASRPWICYWILQALYLLDCEPKPLYPKIIETLGTMQMSSISSNDTNNDNNSVSIDQKPGWEGGFGGGPGQMPHGAPNYAAVLALCTIGTHESLGIINRKAIYRWMLGIKDPVTGAFRIHRDGEIDSRGTYTILAIARILNILTPELADRTAEYLLDCQTYEGGFGGEPGNEAHGGYNFCAVAGLLILGRAQDCNIDALEGWLLRRQVKLEGGFQGRTNKLVDSCYTYWQGAALAMVNVIRANGSDVYDMERFIDLREKQRAAGVIEPSAVNNQSRTSVSADGEIGEISISELRDVNDSGEDDDVQYCIPCATIKTVADDNGLLSFNQKALQRYVLHCAQDVENGGLRDKPGKSRDFYHSCYSLSGLSIAQSFHIASGNPQITSLNDDGDEDEDAPYFTSHVFGDTSNLLKPTSCVFNIGLEKLEYALKYFGSMPSTNNELLS